MKSVAATGKCSTARCAPSSTKSAANCSQRLPSRPTSPEFSLFPVARGARSELEIRVSTSYVERRDEPYMVAGTRVSLDSVVYAFLPGDSAESIAQAS